ncbi:hypothetical protein HK098_000321 [Nowakowskiella sp. JEL0407]|nr:hypothetical protein HK098_000321 [Nowakowskiella sp. JEL0407]
MTTLNYSNLFRKRLLTGPTSSFFCRYSTVSRISKFTNHISLRFDSENGELKDSDLNFSHYWLRDNCKCPKCIHPSSKQKLHSSGDLLQSQLQSVEINNTELQIVWKDNNTGDVDHVSKYNLEYLKSFAKFRTRSTSDLSFDSVKLWTSDSFFRDCEPIKYSSLMKSEYELSPYSFPTTDEAFNKAVRQLNLYGLLFIEDVPSEPTDLRIVENIAQSFGPIKETFYGRSWDVKSEVDAKNIAYTDVELGLHMDILYYESPPGLQFLHCLSNTVSGGSSTYADSFHAAYLLLRESPSTFETLTKTPIPYHYQHDDHSFYYLRPVLSASPNFFLPIEVNYSPPFQAPPEFTDYKEEIKWYEAMEKFEAILRDRKELVIERRMKKGDVAIFANRRVLHGRRQFESGNGERHLRGTYTEWSDFRDRVNVLTNANKI